MIVLVCMMVWFALAGAAIAFFLWAIYHILTTRGSTGRPLRQGRGGEPTSWPSLAAALSVVMACGLFFLGHVSWFGVLFGALGTGLSFLSLRTGGQASKATAYAMASALVVSAVVCCLTLFGLHANSSIRLYGENYGENQGEIVNIQQLTILLPCVDELVAPAPADQGLFQVDTSRFVASASCMIVDAKGARPAVFVQAASPDALEVEFAAGVIEVGKMNENDLWVERDGAVAVITSDEVSGDLAQAVGTTWISLHDEATSG
ncbi:hypothetical protein ES689_06345 [Frigoribacterium sp. ACAM 257]|uniref:hypothetical protein n=1 Tax=Frigoribacterium sp. ACAM 257 TaxID=2508998 RepID=UPI0011B9E8AA|nr:hypothetical protein [Frigoribacterium sp. ACAM 257]TWX38291.1 hypothetical protein ES689_06345 [Frigoribacterium sp. ACAM 257]